MADAKLSALAAIPSALVATDLVFVVRAGVSYKGTVADIQAACGGIKGAVATFNDLPIVVGTPAVGSRYIVETDQGSYFTFNKKPAGLYERVANAGALADWTRLGDFTVLPMKDNAGVYDDGDGTKKVVFQLSSITTGTTRTVTFPDKDGTIAMLSDIPSAGGVPYVDVSIAAWSSPYDTVPRTIEFDTVNSDVDSCWSLVNDEFTAPTDGVYMAALVIGPPASGYNLTRDFAYGFKYGAAAAATFGVVTWWSNEGEFGNRQVKNLTVPFLLLAGEKIKAYFDLYNSEHVFQARMRIVKF